MSRIRDWALEHLARPRPAQSFLPQIDGLRFVAIIAVLLYHVQGYVQAKAGFDPSLARAPLHALMAAGYFGVPLFFAISGFIICKPFLEPRQVSLRAYFLRRLSRLEPPYFINLLLLFAIKLWALDLAFPEFLPHLVASLFYLHGPVYGSHSEVNGVAWSLEVEWQFYLIAPLAVAVVVKGQGWLRHLAFAVLLLAGGLAYRADYSDLPRLDLSLIHYFGFFAAGIWVAIVDRELSVDGGRRVGLDAIGIAAALATLWILTSQMRLAVALPLLTFLIVLGGLRGRILARALGVWPVHCIGAMCYTIYLYHFFVVSALGRIHDRLFDWPASSSAALLQFSAIAVPVTLLACIIPYLLIERPFMVWRPGRTRLRDALLHRRPPPLPEPQP